MHLNLRRLFLFLLLMLLCQCSVPTPPHCWKTPRGSRAPASSLIAEARSSWNILANPARRAQWPKARASYNSAVAKLFDQLRCGHGTWEAWAEKLGTRISVTSNIETNPADLDSLFPASAVKQSKVKARNLTPGVGVPAVGWKVTSPLGRKRAPFLLPNGLPYNLTAVLSFEGKSSTPTWHFIKRWQNEKFPIANARHELSANWSAANEFYWHMCQLDNLLLQNFLLPGRFTKETGIYFVTPYDPKKIPVVFVHGLISSPDTFKNLINELVPEPWFRERYQIWLYNYPTGNPWIFSALNFRAKMHEACAYARTKGSDENLKRMIVVAHSMGGLLTRSSITPPGHALYDAALSKPVDQLHLSPAALSLVNDGLLYQPLAEPSRVVFLAVPHCGSPMADMRLSVWVSRLIRLPKTLTIDLLDRTFLAVSDIAQGKQNPVDHFNSINSLSPENPFTCALSKLPLPNRLAIHSIIGDRGKNNTPNSSDGVVPYWSSHISPVLSEKIVPSGHSVPDCPEAAEELKRILQLHLKGH